MPRNGQRKKKDRSSHYLARTELVNDPCRLERNNRQQATRIHSIFIAAKPIDTVGIDNDERTISLPQMSEVFSRRGRGERRAPFPLFSSRHLVTSVNIEWIKSVPFFHYGGNLREQQFHRRRSFETTVRQLLSRESRNNNSLPRRYCHFYVPRLEDGRWKLALDLNRATRFLSLSLNILRQSERNSSLRK